jgi:hypothetical protein
MFDKEPNIDIVFRNGLKNMEVLPPADVWDNIPPMPVRNQGYRVAMRIAAGISILVALTLLASSYFRSNNGSGDITELAMAADDQLPERITPVEVSTPVDAEDNTASGSIIEPSELARANETIFTGLVNVPAASTLISDFRQTQENVKANNQPPVSSDEITVIVSPAVTGRNDLPSQAVGSAKTAPTALRFEVGASVSPAMGFSSASNNTRLAELINSEQTRPTYSTGLTFGYKISPRLTIQSGIGLSSVGQTITGVDVFAGLSDFYAVKGAYLYSVETASGTILAGNTDLYLTDNANRVSTTIPGNMADPSKYNLTQVSNNIHQVFRYLELPIIIRYKVIDQKVGLNFSGGMSYGYLVDNFAYANDGANVIPIGRTEGVNIHSISSQLGLGMEYNISTNISFNLEPVFKYYVTPVNNLSGTLYKPYSVGFFSGVFFKF